MTCRACGSPGLEWHCLVNGTDGRFAYFRCHECGSLSSSASYADAKHLYNTTYLGHNMTADGGREKHKLQWLFHRNTIDTLVIDRELPKTFLDVGCLEGCALELFQDSGYDVRGWDCFAGLKEWYAANTPIAPDKITIGKEFEAIPGFSAVLCSEVLEHAERPQILLEQLAGSLIPGGILAIQTPAVSTPLDRNWNQMAHLSVFSQRQLRKMIASVGLEILERYTTVWNSVARECIDPTHKDAQLYFCW